VKRGKGEENGRRKGGEGNEKEKEEEMRGMNGFAPPLTSAPRSASVQTQPNPTYGWSLPTSMS